MMSWRTRRFFTYVGLCVLLLFIIQTFRLFKDPKPETPSPFLLNTRLSDMELSIKQMDVRLSSLHGQLSSYYVRDMVRSLDRAAMSNSSYPITQGVIDPRKFTYRINTPRNLCKESHFTLFVYVHSQAVNFERRRILRSTWASKRILARLKVGFVFITGSVTNDSSVMEKIARESETYGDIVQTDYVDTYQNISIKSTASLNWAATYCADHVPTILKSDDDIFVNITRLVDYVNIDLPKIVMGRGDKLILCNLWEKQAVIRKQFDRWFIPRELYENKVYPSFCQGSALIITSPAAVAMRRALIGTRFFPLDDVLLTGFTAPVAGVSLIPINTRHLSSLKERQITNNDLLSDFIFVHTNMPNLIKLWNHTELYMKPLG